MVDFGVKITILPYTCCTFPLSGKAGRPLHDLQCGSMLGCMLHLQFLNMSKTQGKLLLSHNITGNRSNIT
jgi:hypothetical protein